MVEESTEDRMHLRNNRKGYGCNRISKWQLLDQRLTLHSPLFTQEHKQQVLARLEQYNQNILDDESRPLFQHFLIPVHTKIIPDYLKIIQVQFNLGKIIARLQNDFYRHFSQIYHDLRMIKKNVITYNQSTCAIAVEGTRIVKEVTQIFNQI